MYLTGRSRRFGSFCMFAHRRALPIFFFNDTATTEIYTLSLHDALPICPPVGGGRGRGASGGGRARGDGRPPEAPDRKSTRLNSSHITISYAVFCLKKKKNQYV